MNAAMAEILDMAILFAITFAILGSLAAIVWACRL
jgi:hypothetical protein